MEDILMSNLNQFIKPELTIIKSRQHTAKGIDASDYATYTLNANTRFIRIIQLDSENHAQYNLTLDGTTANMANTNAFMIFHSKFINNNSDTVDDRVFFQKYVSGGETLSIAFCGQLDNAWQDRSSGDSALIIQEYAYA